MEDKPRDQTKIDSKTKLGQTGLWDHLGSKGPCQQMVWKRYFTLNQLTFQFNPNHLLLLWKFSKSKPARSRVQNRDVFQKLNVRRRFVQRGNAKYFCMVEKNALQVCYTVFRKNVVGVNWKNIFLYAIDLVGCGRVGQFEKEWVQKNIFYELSCSPH